jgi:hypothetical protein
MFEYRNVAPASKDECCTSRESRSLLVEKFLPLWIRGLSFVPLAVVGGYGMDIVGSWIVIHDLHPLIRLHGQHVRELDPSQVEIVRSDSPPKEKTPAELLADGKKREKAFASFFEGMVEDLSRENREQGDDGNVTGIVV